MLGNAKGHVLVEDLLEGFVHLRHAKQWVASTLFDAHRLFQLRQYPQDLLLVGLACQHRVAEDRQPQNGDANGQRASGHGCSVAAVWQARAF